ncbi:helix-turn-helix transcriptional regulator [Cedecea sp. FDAARGOS_727]|uniref:helix-turn-helix domain-containing protein n=1 Tax=Cedecea sp. FDAARGOS_727 TaxID=2545798 RepID=UPI00143E7553|nr:helix-turn-helix transcriptional regulator [Cedecea sp. FDAARGOS_727]QIX96723.1 transcriptional regulator [Cedecea sp. FDAARGOS_727]
MKAQDWHPADIIAGVKKKGTSLAAISRRAGLASSTLANALTRRWPKGERLIAEALDKPPEEIWPSRYQALNTGAVEQDGQGNI